MIKRSLATTTSYVQKFINTAYDEIKIVYDNLASVISVATNMTSVTNVAAAGDLGVLNDNLTAYLNAPTVGVKEPCICATTVNVTLSGLQVIDTITQTANMRTLVKNQTDPTENGIWLAQTGAWTRATDWDGIGGVEDVQEGTAVPVSRGSANPAKSWWLVDTTGTIAIGVTGVTFVKSTITNAQVTVTPESTDTICHVLFVTDTTGDLAPKTAVGTLVFNSATGALTLGPLSMNGDSTVVGKLQATGDLQTSGGRILPNLGTQIENADIVAGVLTLPTDGNIFWLNSGTTVTSISSMAAGGGGILILYHPVSTTFTDSASLRCIGGIDRNINVTDTTIWVEMASGWRMVAHTNNAGDFRPMAGDGVNFFENTGSSEPGVTITGMKMSWYEEGTWTPYLQDASHSLKGAEGDTYGATNKGKYTRIGRQVFFEGQLAMTGKGTLTGVQDAHIAGLPYANNADVPGGANFSYGNAFLLTNFLQIVGFIPANQKYITLAQFDYTGGTTGVTIDEIQITTKTYFHGQFTI
jgi:hypothetical protein